MVLKACSQVSKMANRGVPVTDDLIRRMVSGMHIFFSMVVKELIVVKGEFLWIDALLSDFVNICYILLLCYYVIKPA